MAGRKRLQKAKDEDEIQSKMTALIEAGKTVEYVRTAGPSFQRLTTAAVGREELAIRKSRSARVATGG